MEFCIQWATLSPFLTPFSLRMFENLFALSSNSFHVISVLALVAETLSTRAISSGYIRAFVPVSHRCGSEYRS